MEFGKYSIRLVTEDDVKDYFHLVDTNRERLKEVFTGTVLHTKTLESTKVFLCNELKRTKDGSYFPYVITEHSSDKIVGFIDLKNIDNNIGKAELGFYMDKEYTGQGIMTEALTCFADYCFGQFLFVKLFLRTHPDNIATRTLAEKCGFEMEGIIRKDYKTTSGEIIDLVYYGRLNPSI